MVWLLQCLYNKILASHQAKTARSKFWPEPINIFTLGQLPPTTGRHSRRLSFYIQEAPRLGIRRASQKELRKLVLNLHIKLIRFLAAISAQEAHLSVGGLVGLWVHKVILGTSNIARIVAHNVACNIAVATLQLTQLKLTQWIIFLSESACYQSWM